MNRSSATFEIVTPLDERSRVNHAVSIPKRLMTDDGREFEIVEWFPDGINFRDGNVLHISVKLIPKVFTIHGD